MANYLVRWEIEIDAGTLEEAAGLALACLRDPESLATCFEVSRDGRNWHVVDLDVDNYYPDVGDDQEQHKGK